MSRIKFCLGACIMSLMLLIIASPVALSQTSKGFIVGNVTDPNGAAVTGATIRIINTATGVTRETVSQGDGAYRFDAVDPGTYNMEVSAGGFRNATRANVLVAAAQTTDAAIQLEVGAASETVTVVATNPVELQSADGTRVNTLDTRQITDLPVPALNPVNLVFTLPGVTDPGPLSGGFVQGTEFSVNGLRARSNSQLIDGLDNNDNSVGGQFYQPVLRDGYNEVAILQSDYSAEFGRAGGAVVNVITRSGTNAFHGSIYDVINNSAFNSRTARQRSLGVNRPVVVENTPGFSIGGPVYFPHFGEGGPAFFKGQNKLFFFATYQADRVRQNTVNSAFVPTAAGFSTLQSLFPNSASLAQYSSVIGNLRATANTFPIALGAGRPSVEFGEASISSTQPVNDDQFLARVDYTPNQRDTFTVRYLIERQNFFNQFPSVGSGGNPFPGFEIDVPSLIQNAYLNYTRILSTRTTNELRFGFGRFNAFFTPRNQSASGQSFGPTIAFSGGGLGQGITGLGIPAGFPQGRIFNNYQLQDTITHTVGNHTFRAGVDLIDQRAKQLIPFNAQGSLTFGSGGGFNALANFLENFSGRGSGGASQSFGSQVIYPNAFIQNYFVNDQWRLRENLTVNLGLRYENYGTPFNAVRFPAFAGFDQPLETVALQQRDNNNFAPRLSFAYQPRFGRLFFGEGRSVIRGGFAVSYEPFFNNILVNTAATPPNVFAVTNLGASLAAADFPRGFANFGRGNLPTVGTPNPRASVNTVPPNLVNPQDYAWNLGIQREIPGAFILDLAYVGTRGTRQFINEQLNPGIESNVLGATLTRTFPTRGSIISRTNGGDSHYNSLQARVERGLSKGLLFRFAYTYAHAIDVANSEVFTTTGGSSVPSNNENRRVDRGNAGFDVRHRGVVSFLYDIPSPFESGFARSLLRGFTLSGVYRIQSGFVQTPYVGGIDLNNDGSAFNDRPAINNPNAPSNSVALSNEIALFAGIIEAGQESATGYVTNTGAPISLANARYLVDTNVRAGLAGRNILRGPRVNRLDLSLNRRIHLPLSESTALELRADFFNVLNHPFFGPGTGDVLDPTFNDPTFNEGGISIGNVTGGRVGQMQIRFVF
jgi:hypothetical protein